VISCQNEAVEKIMRQLKIQVEAYDQQIFMQKEAKEAQKQQLQNYVNNFQTIIYV
jgi:hypothetical protein